MITQKETASIRKAMDVFEDKREELMKLSRDVLRQSKQAIYSVHRKDMKSAEKLLADAKKGIAKLNALVKSEPKLVSAGMYSAACQEYAEAFCYNAFVRNGKIPLVGAVGVDIEDYLGGLSDLTGELGRLAVISATKSQKKDVELIRDAVDAIFGLFVQLDFRNGELRKKADAIKWNTKKIEDLVYDLSIKHR